jgi:glycosyltransferase involved in cell wall biosynthesis
LELAPAALDVLHSVDFIPPFRRLCPAVITVHDLSFLLYPETKTAESLRYYGQIAQAVESADAIIAVSEATRRDMERLLGAPPERVTVVHHGVSSAFSPRPPDAVAAFCRQRGLPETFMLWVGALEPRKNLPCLFRAVAAASARLPEAMRTLVLVGVDGWAFENAQAEFDRLGLAAQTVMFGQATEEELALLYSAAWVFPFPSMYEGFGLPPLEAMACGAPVVSANVSSLPEVLGDAARYFDPQDDAALAELLVALANDAPLRANLRQAGLAHAARFRWEDTAAATLQVYRSVART